MTVSEDSSLPPPVLHPPECVEKYLSESQDRPDGRLEDSCLQALGLLSASVASLTTRRQLFAPGKCLTVTLDSRNSEIS